ncbi:GNAT family N-acetyltransferase [Nocardioides sp. AE5]|uniref:GNAT family N-acetyltransferase n=1 Tax=Nocardioides sp. AE5 TaxID=2962573 RepID=UPI0028822BD8|nr:GNAT family N-acetyltransferase [Nocardioides sp. AE5]MDT0202426.1 GNAT family N-acetyltransferase [Nocardioides sp. AE5]
MSRKTVRITLDNLDALPGTCRSCLFWQSDPVRRNSLDEDASRAAKEDWVSEVLREWGSCGQLVTVDDQPRGYVLYAPPRFVPGADQFPTSPPAPDTVLMTTAYVDPTARGGGLGRLLIQGMARDLVRRHGGVAVEAFGDVRGRSGHCVAPAGFLSAVGFRTQRAHPSMPRMRMELRSALTWRDEFEQALDKLLGAVRPKHVAPEAMRPPARNGP